MNTQEAIGATFSTSSMVLNAYFSDLTDAELMTRPAEGCNHLAWQLGHLIASECHLLESLAPGSAAELPEGFAEQYGKENAGEDDASKFCLKQEYLDLFDQVRAATLTSLAKFSDADLDKPGPEDFAKFCPTVGHVFVLIAMHGMMHAGQFVPVRRKLGKPVLF